LAVVERRLSEFDNVDFDRGASRIVEYGWYLVRALFFLTSIPVPSWILCFWLRLFGAKVGKGVVIRSGVNISFPWRLKIGDHVWLGEEVMILSLAAVTIESSVCVSQRAFLCTGTHDYEDPRFQLVTAPILLKTGCWVAACAFVGPGVEVGVGSVCAAGSVIAKSVPPNCLMAGNPSKCIREFTIHDA
jgi:putative colanic acid biosynthesis acetyltransferase WcaF